MIQIQLSSEEQEILDETLQTALTTLEIEIRRADSPEFKKLLTHRCEVLQGLQAKLSHATVLSA